MTTLLQEYAAAQAERRGDATAVTMHGDRLTYRELDERASRCAAVLAGLGVEGGGRVAILCRNRI